MSNDKPEIIARATERVTPPRGFTCCDLYVTERNAVVVDINTMTTAVHVEYHAKNPDPTDRVAVQRMREQAATAYWRRTGRMTPGARRPYEYSYAERAAFLAETFELFEHGHKLSEAERAAKLARAMVEPSEMARGEIG